MPFSGWRRSITSPLWKMPVIALGANTAGARTGSIAHMSVFSFHPVKHLTTGEGGMVTTDRADFAELLRRFRNHGMSTDARQRNASGQWRHEDGAPGVQLSPD